MFYAYLTMTVLMGIASLWVLIGNYLAYNKYRTETYHREESKRAGEYAIYGGIMFVSCLLLIWPLTLAGLAGYMIKNVVSDMRADASKQ